MNGVILVDTDYADSKTPRMSKEVASALRGRQLSAKDRLKLAGTEVLALVDSSSTSTASMGIPSSTAAGKGAAAAATTPAAGAVDLDNLQALLAQSNAMMDAFADEEANAEAGLEGLGGGDDLDGGSGDDGDGDGDGNADADGDGGAELKEPYVAELDFLEDQFEMVTAQIKLSRETLKRDMREVIGENDMPSWERRGQGVRTNLKEFEAKLRLMKTKVKIRLDATAALIEAQAATHAKEAVQRRAAEAGAGASAGAAAAAEVGAEADADGAVAADATPETTGLREAPTLPRLVVLCERLGLDEFERSVIVLLIGNTVSPLMKEVLKTFEQSIDKYGATDNITVRVKPEEKKPFYRQSASKTLLGY